MVAINALRKDLIFSAVRDMYTAVARHPEREYHFPTGRGACAFLGYPADRIEELPAAVVDAFAGVGNPFAANVIRAGDVVLDVGSGSGTDLLLAARLTGAQGEVIGLDMTPAMLATLKQHLAAAGVAKAYAIEGNAEQIPLPDASVDVVTSNGVFNLIPDKRGAFAEICRVLRPGGRVQIADIAVGRRVSGDCISDPKLWAECIVGATPADEYLTMLEQTGFVHVQALGELDYFSASASAATRSIAESFQGCSIVFRAAKPPSPALPQPATWPPPDSTTRLDRRARPTSTDRVHPIADATLDGYGDTCGMLEPKMKRCLHALESGQVLEVRVDDPAARLGVPAWSRLTGHTILSTVEDDDRRTRFFVRRR